MASGIFFFLLTWLVVWGVSMAVARRPVYYFRQFAVQGLKTLLCTAVTAVIVLAIVYIF